MRYAYVPTYLYVVYVYANILIVSYTYVHTYVLILIVSYTYVCTYVCTYSTLRIPAVVLHVLLVYLALGT